MHALHKILVYIPEAVSDPKNYTRQELINEVRLYAEMNTDDFYLTVFDYRTTETAGRWKNQYPVNVLFAKDDIAKFLQELTITKELQHQEIQQNLLSLKEMIGTDLEEIILEIEKLKAKSDRTEKIDSMADYFLYQIAALLNGTYTLNSYFYNVANCTARLYQGDLTEVENAPDDWALVLFDCHN